MMSEYLSHQSVTNPKINIEKATLTRDGYVHGFHSPVPLQKWFVENVIPGQPHFAPVQIVAFPRVRLDFLAILDDGANGGPGNAEMPRGHVTTIPGFYEGQNLEFLRDGHHIPSSVAAKRTTNCHDTPRVHGASLE